MTSTASATITLPAETSTPAVQVVDASHRGSALLFRQAREMRDYTLAGDSLKQMYALHPHAPRIGERGWFKRNDAVVEGVVTAYIERYRGPGWDGCETLAQLECANGQTATTWYRNVLPAQDLRATAAAVAAQLASDQHVTGLSFALQSAMAEAPHLLFLTPAPAETPASAVAVEPVPATEPALVAVEPPLTGRALSRANRQIRRLAREERNRLTAPAAACDNIATAGTTDTAATVNRQESTMTITAKRTAKLATKKATNGVTLAKAAPAGKRTAKAAEEWLDAEITAAKSAKPATKTKQKDATVTKKTSTKTAPAKSSKSAKSVAAVTPAKKTKKVAAEAKPAIKPSRTAEKAAAATNAFTVRQPVMVRYEDGYRYPAKVVKPGERRTVIEWDNGDGKLTVANSEITARKAKPAAKPEPKVASKSTKPVAKSNKKAVAETKPTAKKAPAKGKRAAK